MHHVAADDTLGTLLLGTAALTALVWAMLRRSVDPSRSGAALVAKWHSEQGHQHLFQARTVYRSNMQAQSMGDACFCFASSNCP